MSSTEDNLMCRVCLTRNGDFVSIHCALITENTDLKLSLYDCWNHCLQWSEEGNTTNVIDSLLPQYICMQCSEDLQVSYNFLKKADKTLTELRSQTLIIDGNNINADFVPEPGSENLEIDGQEDSENSISGSSDFLKDELQEVVTAGNQVESSDDGEEDIEVETQEYIESDDFTDNSQSKHSINDDEFEDGETTSSLTRAQKFRTEDVEDKIVITCIRCAQEFRTYRRFEDHMYEHRGMHPYACCMCSHRLQNMKGIAQHYTKSHGIDPILEQLQPTACERDVFGPENFEPVTMYMCIQCTFEHVEYKVMKNHLITIHELSNPKNIMKKLPFQCPKCLRCFTSREKVVTHSKYEHSAIPYSSTIRTRTFVVCSKCDKRIEASSLKKHEQRCRGKIKTYQCKVCNGVYNNRASLMAHKRDEHPSDPQADSPFRCDTCGNTYRTRIQLRFHVQRHESRHFKCDQCSRTFIRIHDLNKHKLIHTGEMPHKCDVCSASYRYSHALLAHKERIHLNKSFMCKVPGCEAEFRTRSQLNDHKYKHIGNPYKCQICSKDFLRRESLRRHSKAMHDIRLTEEELTNIYLQQMGRYNTHDIRRMAGN